MQKPHSGWVQLPCGQPAGWTGLSEWRETRARCRGDEPCRSGEHPESLENFSWFIGKKKWGAATLLLLMNVHIVTMYVSWFVVHCDKCMVSIALQHCKSYLLNLICRCACVCVRVLEMAKKQKKTQNETLFEALPQLAYLWICVAVENYYNTLCHWLELKLNVMNHFNGNKKLPQQVWSWHW